MPISYRPDLQRFLDRLNLRSMLTEEERQAVLNLPCHSIEAKANVDFVRLGERVDHVCLVVSGLVGRFSQDRHGRRQITLMHVPGDMADLHSVVQPLSTSALQALSKATVVAIPHVAIRGAAGRYPALAEAFWRDCMIDASILAEWVLNVGQRSARERIAHLFCEMAVRTVAPSSGARDVVIKLPITQDQLAGATGLTGVHVNRMLQGLRSDRLIVSHGRGVICVPDWDKLVAAGDFDPAYLSLNVAPEQRLRIVQAS
jgi:CRP-like cAMP-binding protein